MTTLKAETFKEYPEQLNCFLQLFDQVQEVDMSLENIQKALQGDLNLFWYANHALRGEVREALLNDFRWRDYELEKAIEWRKHRLYDEIGRIIDNHDAIPIEQLQDLKHLAQDDIARLTSENQLAQARAFIAAFTASE
jgi:hypothetical protein